MTWNSSMSFLSSSLIFWSSASVFTVWIWPCISLRRFSVSQKSGNLVPHMPQNPCNRLLFCIFPESRWYFVCIFTWSFLCSSEREGSCSILSTTIPCDARESCNASCTESRVDWDTVAILNIPANPTQSEIVHIFVGFFIIVWLFGGVYPWNFICFIFRLFWCCCCRLFSCVCWFYDDFTTIRCCCTWFGNYWFFACHFSDYTCIVII